MSFRTVMVALLAVAAVGCVDGTTPDCSDAASHCGPDFDAYPPDTESDSAPNDAPSEGAADTGGRDTGSEPMPEAGRDAEAG